MPVGGLTLPEAIVGMGSWVADMVTPRQLFVNLEVARCVRHAGVHRSDRVGERLGHLLVFNIGALGGNLIAGAVLAVLAVFMAIVSLLLVLLSYAQVIWAQFAIAVAVALGPIFVPFLLFEPLAFLFWGWLRTLLTYSLYSAVAACVLRVFLAAVRAASDGIWESLTPDLSALGAALMWIVSYIALALAGILATFKIPELASGLVSGSVSGGGMLGALAATADGRQGGCHGQGVGGRCGAGDEPGPAVERDRQQGRGRVNPGRTGHRREHDPRRERVSFATRPGADLQDLGIYRCAAVADIATERFGGHPYAARRGIDELKRRGLVEEFSAAGPEGPALQGPAPHPGRPGARPPAGVASRWTPGSATGAAA